MPRPYRPAQLSTNDIAILAAVADDATTPYAITKKLRSDHGFLNAPSDRTTYRSLLRLAKSGHLVATPNESLQGKILPTTYHLSQKGRNLLIRESKHYQHLSWLIRTRIE